MYLFAHEQECDHVSFAQRRPLLLKVHPFPLSSHVSCYTHLFACLPHHC